MQIMIVSEAKGQTNGVNTTYTNLIPQLESEGHRINIVGSGDFHGRIALPNYKEIEIVAWRPYHKIARAIEAAKPDHVHIATEGPLGMGAAHFCTKNDLLYTTSFHTTFHLYAGLMAPKLLQRTFENAALGHLRNFHNRGNLTMMPTTGLIEEMKGKGFTSPLRLMSRGVNFDLYHPGPNSVFEGTDSRVALFVGRISEQQKNIRPFLNLDLPGWHKVVVGDGPDLPMLQQEYADDVAISFVGKKTGKELAAYYRSSDVFVMPSVLETFGNVTTEALASGLPVAALCSTANNSIVCEDLLGGTDTDLARAFAKAASAPGTAEDRHQYVRQNYTWPKVAGQFMANIREARPDLA